MSEVMQWLEENGPAMTHASKLTWNRGPLDPESGVASVYVIEGMDYSNNPNAPEGTPNGVGC